MAATRNNQISKIVGTQKTLKTSRFPVPTARLLEIQVLWDVTNGTQT